MSKFVIQENETPVDILTRVLKENNYPNPASWINGLPQEALTDPNLAKRVFIINRYWYDVLGSLSLRHKIDTMDARYCLVNTHDLDNWIQSFIGGVLPCLKTHSTQIQESLNH